ncbi:MAG: hypothetical protein V3V00_02845 [Saprospiraceae bacterium]
MKFEQVVGQEKLLEQLKKMVDVNKLPHALFLKGKSGHGALPIAISLASYLLTPKDERSLLEESNSYQKATKGLHPDMNYAFPVVIQKPKKRKDTTSRDFLKEWRSALAANSYMSDSDWIISITTSTGLGDINTTECHQIIRNLTLKPFESEHKVQIIWMPQYLGKNGNRLLKIIEEPPANTYIIFVGDTTESVLNTLTSRCQIFNVPRISDQKIQEALVTHHGLSVEAANRLSFLAEGDYAQAKMLLTLDDSVSLDFVLEWIECCKNSDALKIKNWITVFIEYSKEEQKGIFIYFLKILREIIHLRIMGANRSKLNQVEQKLIENNVTLNIITIGHIEIISNTVNDMYTLLGRNANIKILLFQGSLQIGKIIKMSTLATEV